jgi:hypothetical protein
MSHDGDEQDRPPTAGGSPAYGPPAGRPYPPPGLPGPAPHHLLSALGLLLGILAMNETKTGVKGGRARGAVAAVVIGAVGLIPAALWLLAMVGVVIGGNGG